MKLNEKKLSKIIRESINEIMLGKDEKFTPYTKSEREQNFAGLTQMRNVEYDAFVDWKKKELKKGRNKIELNWDTFKKEVLDKLPPFYFHDHRK